MTFSPPIASSFASWLRASCSDGPKVTSETITGDSSEISPEEPALSLSKEMAANDPGHQSRVSSDRTPMPARELIKSSRVTRVHRLTLTGNF
jgi:hypothetical protein